MKKFVSLALCLALALALAWLPGGAAGAANGAPFAGGSGTEDDPYLVSTQKQLMEVGNYSSCYFLQTKDIELYFGFEGGGVLTGTYDGGGHSITELRTALFDVNNGTIRNLTLVEPRVYAESVDWTVKTDLRYGI